MIDATIFPIISFMQLIASFINFYLRYLVTVKAFKIYLFIYLFI